MTTAEKIRLLRSALKPFAELARSQTIQDALSFEKTPNGACELRLSRGFTEEAIAAKSFELADKVMKITAGNTDYRQGPPAVKPYLAAALVHVDKHGDLIDFECPDSVASWLFKHMIGYGLISKGRKLTAAGHEMISALRKEIEA